MADDDSGSIPWSTVENGIHAWVMAGGGLDADHAKWAVKAKVFPQERYVSMRITHGPNRIGSDWRKYERTSQGIVVRVQGPRTCTLQLRCFNGDELGSDSNFGTLDRIMSAVELPSVRAIIGRSRFGVGPTLAPINVIDVTRTALLEPYAVLEVQLNIASEVSEAAQTIERVGIALQMDARPVVQVWVPDEPPAQPYTILDDAWLDATGKVS